MFHRFIRTMTTLVPERIALARALLRNPKVLLLDEVGCYIPLFEELNPNLP